jgi:amidase
LGHDGNMTTELWQRGALELAGMIADGSTTSMDVLNAHLERVEQVNGHLNAVVRLLTDQARVAAQAADAAVAAGADLGPFHGVPITVKENIDLAGTPTTQGLEILADAVADRDAPVVARMRAAGAIPFARTNLPDLGLRIHTDSQLHGLTRNPWNPSVTAGGSSGGEASALASGMSPFGIGNDIGGSLRNPAHCCGVASIKPTTGVVAMATVIPPLDRMLSSQLMLAEGPMARRVGDVRRGLEVMAAMDPRDPNSLPVMLRTPPLNRPLRIAVLADPPGGDTDLGIANVIRTAAEHLAAAGHQVTEATPPLYEESLQVWAALLLSDLRSQRELLDMVIGEAGRRVLDNLDAKVPTMDAAGVMNIHPMRFGIMRAWSEFFTTYDLVISPTWAHPAFPHDADLNADFGDMLLETFRPVLPANLLGLPAAVVPGGIANSLPVGVQVMGERFDDLICLHAAEQIETAVGPLTPINPITSTSA